MIHKRYLKHVILILCLFLGQGFIAAYGQVSVQDVKLSGNYRWGEGFATDRDQAIALARQNLIEGIFVVVTSDVKVQTEERDENVTSEFQSNVRTQSQMGLLGLENIPEQRRDGSWRVVAYISNENLEKSIQMEQRRLSAKLVNAYQADLKGEKNKAIRLYFETFIESYNIRPEPIPVDSSLFGSDINIRQYSRDKLIDWLNDVELEATGVQSFSTDSTTMLNIEISASINNQPASNMVIAVNKPDYGSHYVRNGFSTVFYDREPENRIQEIDFKLTLSPLVLHEEIREFAENITPVRIKSVSVDFEDVIDIDFIANRLSDGSYRFSARVNNLSVSDIEWRFGDGNYSNEPSPRHLFEDEGTQEVTLTLNNSDELSITKEIDTTDRVSFSRDQSNTFTRRSVVMESENGVPFQHRDYIERIRRMPDHISLESYLVRLRNSGVLQMGGPNSVKSQDKSYIIITDPDTEKVEAILSPVKSYVRYVITEDEPVTFGRSDWRDQYRGFIPIWVEFN